VLGARKLGGGQQLEIQWYGQQTTTWEAASRMRRQYPQLVQEFEQQQQQQSAEGALATDESALQVEAVMEQSGGALARDSAASAMEKRLEDMSRLIEQQAQRAEEQQKQVQEQQALIAQLRASPAHSPQSSVHASPQRSPHQASRSIAAAAAAGAQHAAPQLRFARREPRATDLREYDGASGDKLDAWLDELGAAVELYELGERKAVLFAASRLREAARQWWNALGAAGKASVMTTDALAQAMRARFQPITAAHTARVQLDKLAQGSRSVNEYIADFQRLRTRLPDMAEADALHAFKRGLRGEIAQDLRKQRVATLADAISLAAHVGSDGSTQGSKASLHQMDVDDGDGNAGKLDRIEAASTPCTRATPAAWARRRRRTTVTRSNAMRSAVGVAASAVAAVVADAASASVARPRCLACPRRWCVSAWTHSSACAVAARATIAPPALTPSRREETKRPGAGAALAAQSAAAAGAQPSRTQRASHMYTQRQ